MHSSFKENNWSFSQVETLKGLLSCQNIRILSKQGGGNSVVFCIEADGKKWALKSYPPAQPHQRNRLVSERLVYEFLNAHQISSVPSLKTYHEEERWLVMDWVEGAIPLIYEEKDIAEAIQFLQEIYYLNAFAVKLPTAAEACLSLNSLLTQIHRRFENLKLAAKNEAALNHYLTADFYPLLEFYQQNALEGYLIHELNIQEELVQTKRSLIPADFGFHNSIRDKTGTLYFFDFDYFGWDDPVKLLADIIWHPKMNLSTPQQTQFTKGLMNIYKDETFHLRFHFTKPLFGLRWALILLNEFILAYWQNRQHAGTFSQDLQVVKVNQLNRAKELLTKITQQGSSYEVSATACI